MINRGIKFYDTTDISAKLFYPMIAKEFEIILMNEEIKLDDPELSPSLIIETKSLSYFNGDYEVYIIPTKIVELYMLKQHLGVLMDDPILAESDSLKEQYLNVCIEFEMIQLTAEKDIWGMKSFVVISLITETEKVLKFVRTGIPKNIQPFLIDERVYELEDGQVVISDDGLPMHGVYYYYHEDKIRYTSDPSKGKHVGDA